MPTTKVDLGYAKVWTIRELTERTADIVAGVVESEVPAIVSRHGRLVATIQTIPPGVEAELMRTAAAEPIIAGLGRVRPDGTADALTAEEIESLTSTPAATEHPGNIGPIVVSMAELNQHTSRVVAQTYEHQRPAIITRRGRLHAALIPLPHDLELQLLRLPGAQELIGSLGRLDADGTAPTMSPAEALAHAALHASNA